MFIAFFYHLRGGGLRVSLTEWMTFIQALKENLHDTSFSGFYTLARACLVKSETDFDLFDRLFLEFFKDVYQERITDEMMNWLNNPKAFDEVPVEFKQLMEMTGMSMEEIEELFRQRLEEQDEEHNGGKRWIGTGGKTPFGNNGQVMGGIRVGGQSRYRSAYRVAGERRYRDWRRDKTIDSRQFQMAFRNLRQMSDRSLMEKTELDVDNTIRKTCDKGGMLDVVMKAPRKNVLKLMLLMDSGGSMDYYQNLCTLLFQTVQKANNFDDVKYYYFHNFIGKSLYTDPHISYKDRVPTQWVLDNIDSSYKVIILGDAEMNPYDLTAFDWWNSNKSTVPRTNHRFFDIKARYPNVIWLHPQKAPTNLHHWSQSFFMIKDIFPMYRLSLEGLNEGIHKLLSYR